MFSLVSFVSTLFYDCMKDFRADHFIFIVVKVIMAKRQRTLQKEYFRSSFQQEDKGEGTIKKGK